MKKIMWKWTTWIHLTYIYKAKNQCRSSHRRCSMKKVVLKNFATFTRKHLCWSLFLINCRHEQLQLYWKKTPTHVFWCEYCEIFRNAYFGEHLRSAAYADCSCRLILKLKNLKIRFILFLKGNIKLSFISHCARIWHQWGWWMNPQ